MISPQDIDPAGVSAIWQRLEAAARSVAHDETRGQLIAAWRRRFADRWPVDADDYAPPSPYGDVPPPDEADWAGAVGGVSPQAVRGQGRVSASGDEAHQPVKATPFVWRDEADIPPRKWLYGSHLLRRFISVDVAAGGIGKSSVKIGEALAMASNRSIYGQTIGEGPLRVWLYNLEDPLEETERRLHATAKRFEISPAEISDRLFVDSGREQPCIIAEELQTGARIVRPVVESLCEELTSKKIDVLIIDPFVSSHSVDENNNRSMDMVVKEWGRVAERCNCSINLVHHVRKANGTETTAESARGAKSITDAARSVIVYNRMTSEEAKKAGIDEADRGFFFRTQNDKANLAPPDKANWFRMNNEDLANGDKVGVACPWTWPDPFRDVTLAQTREAQRIVANDGPWRLDPRAKNNRWVGVAAGQALGLDWTDEGVRKRLSSIIHQWVKNGVLKEVDGVDEHRKPRTFVEVGTWITE